jgi:hypothetical protein
MGKKPQTRCASDLYATRAAPRAAHARKAYRIVIPPQLGESNFHMEIFDLAPTHPPTPLLRTKPHPRPSYPPTILVHGHILSIGISPTTSPYNRYCGNRYPTLEGSGKK